MSFSGSILEYILISLTITSVGSLVTYGSVYMNKNGKINKSIVDDRYDNNKNVIDIEYDDNKDTISVKKQLIEAIEISEKITREPLKVKYKPKPNKQKAIISHVLEPNEKEKWTGNTIATGRSKKKNYEVKLWMKQNSTECRFTWNWKSKKEKSNRTYIGNSIEDDKYKNCQKKGFEIKDRKNK